MAELSQKIRDELYEIGKALGRDAGLADYQRVLKRWQATIDAQESQFTQSQLTPDRQPFMDEAILKLKAAYSSTLLLADALGTLRCDCYNENYDLNTYRMRLEECGPILNSLCDCIDDAREILRIEAERSCREARQ